MLALSRLAFVTLYRSVALAKEIGDPRPQISGLLVPT
jgi:hypothetical protein